MVSWCQVRYTRLRDRTMIDPLLTPVPRAGFQLAAIEPGVRLDMSHQRSLIDNMHRSSCISLVLLLGQRASGSEYRIAEQSGCISPIIITGEYIKLLHHYPEILIAGLPSPVSHSFTSSIVGFRTTVLPPINLSRTPDSSRRRFEVEDDDLGSSPSNADSEPSSLSSAAVVPESLPSSSLRFSSRTPKPRFYIGRE